MMSSGLNTHDRKRPTATGQGPPCSPSLFTIPRGTQQEKQLHLMEVGTDQVLAQRGPVCLASMADWDQAAGTIIGWHQCGLVPPYLGEW